MISNEEAQKRLESLRKTDAWVDAGLAKLAGLDAPLAETGRLLMGRKPDGKKVADDRDWRFRAKGQSRLAKLTDAQVLAVLTSLFPKLSTAIRGAWDAMAELPYTHGYSQRGFRAPGRPSLHRRRREAWAAELIRTLEGYDEDAAFVAAWAQTLDPWHGSTAGLLLAGELSASGPQADAVYQTLIDGANNAHETAAFGKHTVTALLCSPRPEGWEFLEKMLLAAQRQEGLRQSILETIDLSRYDAFRRMLRVILENGLSRFSSVVRAADVWFGTMWAATASPKVEGMLESAVKYLDDDAARDAAVRGDDAEQVYLGLWANAAHDAPSVVDAAGAPLRHRKADVRYAAASVLFQTQLVDAVPVAMRLLDDDDLRVSSLALDVVKACLRMAAPVWRKRHSLPADEPYSRYRGPPPATDDDEGEDGKDNVGGARAAVAVPAPAEGEPRQPTDEEVVAEMLEPAFERIEALLNRIPDKPQTLKPVLWPWTERKLTRSDAAGALLDALGPRPLERVLKYADDLEVNDRARVAVKLGSRKDLPAELRLLAIKLVGDASPTVREQAVHAVRKLKPTANEVAQLEPLLSRKANDLRRAILSLVLTLPDDGVLATADRLLAAKAAPQRLAGLELLRELVAKERSAAAARARAASYAEAHREPARDEQVHLDALLQVQAEKASLENALGLCDRTKLTKPEPARKLGKSLDSPAAQALLRSLDDLVHEHRETPIPVERFSEGQTTELLGAVRWGFPGPFKMSDGKTVRRGDDELPLRDVWIGWYDGRPDALRDDDGLELLRAVNALYYERALSRRSSPSTLKLRYREVVQAIVAWLRELRPLTGANDAALDAIESHVAAFDPTWKSGQCMTWREDLDHLRTYCMTESRTPEQTARLWRLMTLAADPGGKAPKHRPPFDLVAAAYELGHANEHDVFDALVGKRYKPDEQSGRGAYYYGGPSGDFDELYAATDPRQQLTTAYPKLRPLVDRAVARVLEVELARGEQETVVSAAATRIRHAGGMDVLVRVLEAAGKDAKLNRRLWAMDNGGKGVVFSHLMRVCRPAEGDTPERFAAEAKKRQFDEAQLIALAMYAWPWAWFVEAALGWPGAEEAIWWVHAHTKDAQWSGNHEDREQWQAQVSQRTPLSFAELSDGAVDVAWFHRVYGQLGAKRWEAIHEMAKYASSGVGHRRAQIFADAMLGKLKRADLLKSIKDKRNQDHVRAIGLVPLAKPKKGANDGKDAQADPAKKDLLERYKAIAEFVRTGRQFGQMKQASEKRAAAIGQENLARTAGYPDPVRLQWAMEAESIADLAKGPVVVKVKDVEVSLAIGTDGLPEVTVTRDGKELKSVPASAKSDAKVKALSERRTELRRTASRMRQSLELSMCRGDVFGAGELRDLFANPILAPMLERLVFVGEGIAGYPVDGGRGLRDHAGKVEPVKKNESLRLAHPHDLLRTRKWHLWQRDCFAVERVQPFKQVFRELYLPTDAEREGKITRRYAGQQVNPRQAMALLGSRGWVAAPEQGVFRPFYDKGVAAWVSFQEHFHTPAEVEGLTVEGVHFARRGEWDALPLKDVDPRLFSEVLRDVDLVVGVAHQGGVDPEASASTVEMRASLLRETAALLKLKNVRVEKHHALVDGKLGQYSVHLGSATTHRLPGGALFIVAVHSQHRGRVFLPFADDDAKTAEVISKVLLLARDEEIRDPQLLSQIRAMT